MKISTKHLILASSYLLLAVQFSFVSGCTRPNWHFGVGGKYNEGMLEVTRGRGGNIDRAISSLETVVRDNPTYRDSLTLLARAYYKKGRYEDARQVLERALAVNQEDEIAWLVLGLAELRLGDNEKGLENIKGGLTLFARASQDGYQDYEGWDRGGLVKTALRRSVFAAAKGLEEKDRVLGSVESLLAAIDQEKFHQRFEGSTERYREQ